MEVLQESGTAVLRAWYSAPGYCREADAVFPRSPFRVTAVMEAIGTIEPYAVLFTRMPMRYAVNLLFFNWIYILCGIAFSALCFLGLSLFQKRVGDEP